MEKGIEVFHAFDDEDGGTQDDARPDLRETADVIERSIDHEDQIMGKNLTSNQIFCISNEGAMTDHHTFRLARSACSIENICYSVGRLTQAATDFLEQDFRHTMLQRGRHATSEMDGHIGDKEVDVL